MEKLEKKIIIDSVDISYEISYPNAEVWLTINVNSNFSGTKKGVFNIVLEKDQMKEAISISHLFEPGKNSIDAVVRVDEASLWYPAGIGEQNTYELLVGIEADNAYQDVCKRVVGICEKEIKYSHENEYLVLNNRDVFVKACRLDSDLAGIGKWTFNRIKSANFNSIIISHVNDYEKLDYCTEMGLIVFEASEIISNDISKSINIDNEDIDSLIQHDLGKWNSKEEYGVYCDIYRGRQLSWLIQQSRILKECGIISIDYEDVFSNNVEFYVKRAFDNIRLTYFYYDKNVSVYYVNEKKDSMPPVTLKLGVLDLKTNKITNQVMEIDMAPMTAKSIIKINDWNLMIKEPQSQIMTALLLDENKKQLARSTFFATNTKDIVFEEPEIFISKFRTGDDEWRLALTTKGYARCLEIKCLESNCSISDNYFDLMPNEAKEVIIKGSVKKPEIKLKAWNR